MKPTDLDNTICLKNLVWARYIPTEKAVFKFEAHTENGYRESTVVCALSHPLCFKDWRYNFKVILQDIGSQGIKNVENWDIFTPLDGLEIAFRKFPRLALTQNRCNLKFGYWEYLSRREISQRFEFPEPIGMRWQAKTGGLFREIITTECSWERAPSSEFELPFEGEND